MQNNILKILLSQTALSVDMSLSERVLYAVKVTFIGMATIFAALALIWGTLELMHFIMSKCDKRRSKKKAASIDKVTVVASQENAAAKASEEDNAEIIAVITAAIASAIAEDSANFGAKGFRVVSFKRTSEKNR